MTASVLVDPRLLSLEARVARAEDQLSVLSRQVRRLRDDRDHYRRRLQAAAAVLDRHNPAHGHRVLLQNLRYVLGASRDHVTTIHQQGDRT